MRKISVFSDKTLLDWVRPTPPLVKKSEYFLIRIFGIGRDPPLPFWQKVKKKQFFMPPLSVYTGFKLLQKIGDGPSNIWFNSVKRCKCNAYWTLATLEATFLTINSLELNSCVGSSDLGPHFPFFFVQPPPTDVACYPLQRQCHSEMGEIVTLLMDIVTLTGTVSEDLW